MMHLGLIGAVVGVLFIIWLIPALVGALFSGVWWLIKLPFRLLWLLVADGLGGLLALLWRLFSGFFGLFGWLGTVIMWLVIIAAVIFGGMTVFTFISGAKKPSGSSSEDRSAGEEQTGPTPPPRFAQRAWALNELGLSASAGAAEIKSRYHELVKREHPDRLGELRPFVSLAVPNELYAGRKDLNGMEEFCDGRLNYLGNLTVE